MKVVKGMCNQCLFSVNKVVSEKRKEQLIKGCMKNNTHFICHKTKDTVCGGFYKDLGGYSQMVRIAERLNMIEFVESVK